jgi:phage tail sheath gpL-like
MNAISFDLIPNNIRTPGAFFEIDNTRALKGLPGMPCRIMVIGQKLATGTEPAEVPVRITSEAQAEAAFGRGSMLHRMFRALKKTNDWSETWGIPLDDDGAAAAATGNVLFGGAVTAAGTINLYIDGQRVRIGVAVGDTNSEIATAVAAAINAATDLPVTAAVNGVTTEQIDITARNKGEAGNSLDIRTNYYVGEALPTGLTATITAMNGGSANPDITAATAAFGDTWYTDVAMPYTDAANLTVLEAEMEALYGPLEQADSFAYAAARGSFATLVTLGNSRNSPHLSILQANGNPNSPEQKAAALTGVAAYFTNIDPARPLQTLPLKGILPPDPQDRFNLSERNQLLFDGISTTTVNDGGVEQIERIITTYETNANGVDDPSYLDMVTLKTIAYVRYAMRVRVLTKFPRHKLAGDGNAFGKGQAIMTPSVMEAEMTALGMDLVEAGIIENLDQWKSGMIYEIPDGDVNRMNAVFTPDLVNQFRVFAARISFIL